MVRVRARVRARVVRAARARLLLHATSQPSYTSHLPACLPSSCACLTSSCACLLTLYWLMAAVSPLLLVR